MPKIKSGAQKIELTDFSGGLNTRQSPRSLSDNETPNALNVDITAEGAIQARFGYELVCALPAGTRTYGVMPFYRSTGALRAINWGTSGALATITVGFNATVANGDTLTPTVAVKSLAGNTYTYATPTTIAAWNGSTFLQYYTLSGSTAVLYFGRAMNTSVITSANINGLLALNHSHAWNAGGVVLNWNSSNTILTITNVAGTVAIGDNITPDAAVVDILGNSVVSDGGYSFEAPFTSPRIVSAYLSNVAPLLSNQSVSVLFTVAMDQTTLPVATLETTLGLSGGHTFGTNVAPTFKRLCVFGSDGHMYYLDGSSTTPVDAGSYINPTGMTATDIVRGAVFDDYLVFGNGTANPAKYDGNSLSALTTYAVGAKNNIFEVFGANGASAGYKMYGAGANIAPSTMYFSESGNPDNWDAANDAGATSVSLNDGEVITGMKALENNLFVFKTDNTYIANAYQLPSTGDYVNTVRITPNRLAAGCVAPSSIAIFNNDIIRLTDPYTYGITSLGFQNNLFTQNQRNGTLSWKIKPTIQGINTATMQKACATYYGDKYILSVPTGASLENNSCITYSLTVDGRGYFMPYNNIPAVAFAQFKNANNKNELYFASNLEAKLFKFNTTFVDNGGGYRRFYQTKIFTLGDRKVLKKFHKFWIRGALSGSTDDLICRVVVDGYAEEFTIDQSYLELTPSGETMGDNIYGDNVFGGTVVVDMNRFMYRDDFPLTINNGREIYLEFENTGAGMGWKIDYIGLEFEMMPDENYPMTLTSPPSLTL